MYSLGLISLYVFFSDTTAMFYLASMPYSFLTNELEDYISAYNENEALF